MLKGNHMVTDQTPSLQELLNKDFSATKSNDEDTQEHEPKPVFLHAQTSKRQRNKNNNTQGSHNAGNSFVFDQFQDMEEIEQPATSKSRIAHKKSRYNQQEINSHTANRVKK